MKFILTGDKALDRKLRELEPKVFKQVLRPALRAAIKPVVGQLRAESPKRSGFMARKIKVRAMKAKKGRVGITVGVGDKDYVGKTFYAAFLIFGHHIGKRVGGHHETTSQGRRFWPGDNFMKRVFDREKGNIRQRAVVEIENSLQKIMAQG